MQKTLRKTVIFLCVGILLTMSACEEDTIVRPTITRPLVRHAGDICTESGLCYRIIKVGTGEVAAVGMRVETHYTGWLQEYGKKGTRFDSSYDRDTPFSFDLGAGRVIRGFDEGIVGMRVGELRTLIIPPELGYGSRGAGAIIPPNATLIFDVELLGV